MMQFENVIYLPNMAWARRLKHLLLCEPDLEIDGVIQISRMGSLGNKILSALGIQRSAYEVCMLVTTPLAQAYAVQRLAEANGAKYDVYWSALTEDLDSDAQEALGRLVDWDAHLAKVPGLLDHTREP